MTYQRTLEFDLTDSRKEQARRQRCERLLASLSDRRIVKASRLFDAQAHQEAERRCQAANQRNREFPVQVTPEKTT